MEWYEKSGEDYEKMIDRLNRNLSEEELIKYRILFEKNIRECCNNGDIERQKYWIYELKTIEDCLKCRTENT